MRRGRPVLSWVTCHRDDRRSRECPSVRFRLTTRGGDPRYKREARRRLLEANQWGRSIGFRVETSSTGAAWGSKAEIRGILPGLVRVSS